MRTIHSYFFSNRQYNPANVLVRIRRSRFPFSGWTWELTSLMPRWNKYEASSRTERYLLVARKILAAIVPALRRPGARLGIEYYALGITASRDRTYTKQREGAVKLCEFGGLLRSLLRAQGFSAQEIPPLSAKKIFARHGFAKKWDMIHAAEKYFGLPPIVKLLGQGKIDSKDPPAGHDDIIDSLAIALSVLLYQRCGVPNAK